MPSDMSHEEAASRMISQLYDRVHYMNSADKEKFSADEVLNLRLSWNAWVAGDLSTKGFLMFTKMFEQRKETKEVFHFARGTDAKQMQQSNKVLFHVTRVMKHIDEVIKHADRLEEVVPMLRQVGGRHGCSGYDVPADYFPHLGAAMRCLLKECYQGYNTRLEETWTRCWNFMIKQMQHGQTVYGGGSS